MVSPDKGIDIQNYAATRELFFIQETIMSIKEMPENPIAFSPDGLARATSVSLSLIRREIKQGHLRPARIGSRYVISSQEVAAWLARRGDGAGARPFVE